MSGYPTTLENFVSTVKEKGITKITLSVYLTIGSKDKINGLGFSDYSYSLALTANDLNQTILLGRRIERHGPTEAMLSFTNRCLQKAEELKTRLRSELPDCDVSIDSPEGTSRDGGFDQTRGFVR